MLTNHISALKQFLHSTDTLMLVIGKQQSGKTELLNTIVEQFKLSHYIIRLQGHPDLHPAQMIKVLTKHWAVSKHYKPARLEGQLSNIIRGLSKHDQSCLLIIDDAHLLPLSVLAAVSYLSVCQEGKKTRLHILMSGRPTLAKKLSGLNTKLIPQIILGGLNREQAFNYVRDLLHKINPDSKEAIPENTLQHFYEKTGGLPESLENAVHEYYARAHFPTTSTESVTTELPEIAPPKPALPLWQNYWQKHGVKTLAIPGLLLTAFTMLWIKHHNVLLKPNTLAHQQTAQNHLTDWHHAVVQHPATEGRAKRAEIITATATHLKPSDLIKSAAIQSAFQQLEHVQPEKTAQQKVDKKAAIHYKFTLQLMGTRHQQDLKSFVNSHHLAQMTSLIHTTYKGKPWYILTYGHYQTPLEARAARQLLPGYLKKLHPWIKPLKS